MNARLARRLVGLYPRAWRVRYGDEFAALLEEERGSLRVAANAIRGALRERAFPTIKSGAVMHTYPQSVIALAKRPSAFLPMAMSLIALTLVLVTVAVFGVVHETDEGAVAHIWQLLMAAQIPLLLFFCAKWLPRAPRDAVSVLALQAAAWLAAVAPVYFLGL